MNHFEKKQPGVPSVRLYVDRREQDGWFLNVGHVVHHERRRTEPHAHPDYGQLIFIQNGSGTINLEGNVSRFDSPCALIIPPACVHGIDYSPNTEKWVVTVEINQLMKINAQVYQFVSLWNQPRVVEIPTQADFSFDFCTMLSSLKQEMESNAIGNIVGAEARLVVLQLALIRLLRVDADLHERVTRHDVRKVEQFRKLIEQHFRDNLSLKEYASMMGMSIAQLRSACSSACEKTPTKLIHDRIVTEAKRDLIFGKLSIAQIAFSLGFSDAAYFTHFFGRETGQSPSVFRLTAHSQNLDHSPAEQDEVLLA
jgi:AraC family transcriptional regulator, transcriptional activator of pobA